MRNKQITNLQPRNALISRRELIVSGTLTALLCLTSKDYPTPSSSNFLQNINIQSAKRQERIRQAYLDSVFKNHYETGGESWQSIEKLVYDPDLEKMFALGKELNKRLVIGYKEYFDRAKQIIMATPYFGNKGKKSNVYVTQALFEIAETDDEVCVEIDNESVHAMVIEKGYAHIPLEGIKLNDYTKLSSVIQEILSFEFPFYNIRNGKRKVR